MPLYTGSQPIFWYRYVDDILCLLPSDFDINAFLYFINNIYDSLKFTVEVEIDGKIPFLDVLIHNCNSHLKFSVYRKPTNSNMYLHYFSHTSIDLKIGLAQCLFLRAYRICSECFLDQEICLIKNTLKNLAYPDFV